MAPISEMQRARFYIYKKQKMEKPLYIEAVGGLWQPILEKV